MWIRICRDVIAGGDETLLGLKNQVDCAQEVISAVYRNLSVVSSIANQEICAEPALLYAPRFITILHIKRGHVFGTGLTRRISGQEEGI